MLGINYEKRTRIVYLRPSTTRFLVPASGDQENKKTHKKKGKTEAPKAPREVVTRAAPFPTHLTPEQVPVPLCVHGRRLGRRQARWPRNPQVRRWWEPRLSRRGRHADSAGEAGSTCAGDAIIDVDYARCRRPASEAGKPSGLLSSSDVCSCSAATVTD